MNTQPSPAAPKLLRRYVLVFIVALLVLCCVGPSIRYNLQAPLVLDVKARSCSLSLGGSYMHIMSYTGIGDHGLYIYSISSGKRVSIPTNDTFDQTEIVHTWVSDSLFFYSEKWELHSNKNAYDLPENGWIVDVPNQVVTNTMTLDNESRDHILHLAQQQMNKTIDKNRFFPIISPNNQYAIRPVIITDVQSGKELNYLPPYTLSNDMLCFNAWKPDSSGYYFIARPLTFLGGEPGPIRLLLTHPPVP